MCTNCDCYFLQVRSVTFPSDVLRPNSLLSGLVLDDQNDDGTGALGGDCENVFVYLSDTTNPGLIVYDAARDSAWRIQNPAMFPDPDFGTYTVSILIRLSNSVQYPIILW